jgi:hypothetical protein
VQTTGDWWLEHQHVDRAEVVEGLVEVIAAVIPEPRRTDAGLGHSLSEA